LGWFATIIQTNFFIHVDDERLMTCHQKGNHARWRPLARTSSPFFDWMLWDSARLQDHCGHGDHN